MSTLEKSFNINISPLTFRDFAIWQKFALSLARFQDNWQRVKVKQEWIYLGGNEGTFDVNTDRVDLSPICNAGLGSLLHKQALLQQLPIRSNQQLLFQFRLFQIVQHALQVCFYLKNKKYRHTSFNFFFSFYDGVGSKILFIASEKDLLRVVGRAFVKGAIWYAWGKDAEYGKVWIFDKIA